MSINDLETILDRYQIDPNTWASIKENVRFTQLLRNAIEEWEGAKNTPERVKIKSATMIELWLEHANELLHKSGESLTGKTELAKFIARLGDMAIGNAKSGGDQSGERFSFTINLGADQQLKFEKQLPTKVIDHIPTPTQET